jgi:hypothetical protein
MTLSNDLVDTSNETDLPPQPPADSPIHLARCASCGFAVQYRPMPSGAGFMLLDNLGPPLGIGPEGRPMCPHDHGELAIADDQLPAAEAITQAAGRLRPEQQPLFEPPPFNSVNALAEIFRKRHDIAHLDRVYDDAAKEAKLAREARDNARELLGKMIDRFEQESKQREAEILRRREAREQPELLEVAQPEETGSDPVREAMNKAAADRMYEELDEPTAIEILIDQLEASAGVIISKHRAMNLSPELLAELGAWAGDAEHNPTERDRWMAARPRALAGMHIAAPGCTSEAVPGDTYQCCAVCGARLGSVPTGSEEMLAVYPGGTLVGEDCPGPEIPKSKTTKRRRAKL